MNVQVKRPEAAALVERSPFEEIDVRENNYFPTQVFSVDLSEDVREPLNSHLLRMIYADRDADTDGIQRSNFRALGGWHSQNKLHKVPDYSGAVSLVKRLSDHICHANGYHHDYELSIGTMWSIINPPGSFNRAHIHPGCIWSGVYYVQTPENCGKIEFLDPRTEQHINPPKFEPNKSRPKKTWSKVRITPKAGKMLIFPSWLYHGVDPNLSELDGPASDRVIISFNLNQKRK
ncbi:MAG: TIGR02466 family protein [Pseudomonadota bacterium]